MIFNLIIKVLLGLCLILSLIMLLPGNILLDVHPTKFLYSFPRSLEKFNQLEDIGRYEFKKIGSILSPESIAYFDGRLVTGSYDGTIYEINQDGTVKNLTKINDSIEGGKWFDRRDGRILGLQFDSKGNLFLVKPYYGVYKVENIFDTTPKVSLVLDIEKTLSLGTPSKFLDDVAIQQNQNGDQILYVTDLSTKFSIEEVPMIMLGSDTSGRILRFDISRQKLGIIAGNLFAPNGIETIKDNSALIFSEYSTRRIWKYWLKGENKGKLEKIMVDLPSETDNIRMSATGHTYWLAMASPRCLLSGFSELDYFMKKPLLRKLILRSWHLVGLLLDYGTRLIPNDYLKNLAYDLKTLKYFNYIFDNPGGMLLEIDQDGNILNSIYSLDENLGSVSEVREVLSKNPDQRILYLGSFSRPYIRKMIISKP